MRSINLFLLLLLGSLACEQDPLKVNVVSLDETLIRQTHQDYVDGWLENDREKILGLLVEDSRIQPNRMAPIEGKENIAGFWFPDDGSITEINNYVTKILSLTILDTIAVTTHSSILDWNYQKDSVRFGMIQTGINSTVYRKEGDSWKIWRSMWTDIEAETK